MTKTLDTRFASAEESPGFLLWKAANTLQRLHVASLAGLGITPNQFSVLTSLVYLRDSGPVTASRVVEHTGLDKMTVSDLVAALVRKRFVSRAPNPDDRRSMLLSPTAQGQRVTNSAIRSIESVDAELFEGVADLPAFKRNLRKLAEAEVRAPDR